MKPLPFGALIIGFAMLAAGCTSLPPVKHILLSVPPEARSTAQPSHWDVARVQMPEYLDSTEVWLRTEDYILMPMRNAYWAQRLPVAMTQLLQQTINAKLLTHRDAPYRVRVQVDAFAPQPDGNVVLSARWRVVDTRSDRVVHHDDTLIRQPLAGALSAATVGRAMSEAVRQLAFQIVAAAS